MKKQLSEGIYDHLLNENLLKLLERIRPNELNLEVGALDDSLLPDYLTRTLLEHIRNSLGIVKEKSARYDLANRLLSELSEFDDDLAYLKDEKLVEVEGNLLIEIYDQNYDRKKRPSTSLSFPSLFTGAAGSPQLGHELSLELESADRVDMLVSFIKSAGVNLLFSALQRFTERGGKLRVITTTYLGASDPAAIHKLSALKNTKIKVNYDTDHSRLHAKAYFVHRNSGLSCAYIGSANLSHAAMTSGLEWTVKLPLRQLPDLFRRCEAEFDTYWESPGFKSYYEGDLDTLVKATRREKYYTSNSKTLLTVFELSPFDHQSIILDGLREARGERNQYRNLVVAATGTGKTMIAAFDYQSICSVKKKRPSVLFLAHRKEILEQACASFRQVLKDGDFGELLFDGREPRNYEYLFCSVPSFNSRELIKRFGSDYWDVVILDEAHHGKAKSYKDILQNLQPDVLLGLTATPERGDGSSIEEDFDFPLAGEIRLPDALEQKLLCPFHYYAVSDYCADYSIISWRNGRYDRSELSDLLTGDKLRVQLIIDKIIEYLPAPLEPYCFDHEGVRGLGFCASKRHAHFMADSFNQAGIRSVALDSETEQDERRQARSDLKSGSINFIFTVDLFNEGVDIPEINCLLFLRPTESHVVYLQQFGRGLRHCKGKDQLIVLDFIGKERKEFRYDLRLKALLPGKRYDLSKEIETGFPHLPAGCSIQFEKTAKEQIINNIRRTYKNIDLRVNEAFSRWKDGVPPTFKEFIRQTEESPIELLTRKSWSDWKEASGFVVLPDIGLKAPERNSLARASLINSPEYLIFIEELLLATDSKLLKLVTNQYAASAYYLLWNKPGVDLGFESLEEAFQTLKLNSRYVEDLLEVLEYCKAHQIKNPKVNLPFYCPLELHGMYSMREISAAFGKATLQTSGPTGTGVVSIKKLKLYLHFVTFEKTEKLFTESTMYRDFLSSRVKLHWESQSRIAQETPTGQNYIHHKERGYTMLFFARFRNSEGRLTSPFTYLGTGEFISAKGNRPIEMVWGLNHAVSQSFFHEAKLAAGIS